MPYCPQCRRNFPEGTETCPQDQQELVDELPYQAIEGPDGNTWVEIAGASTEDEAEVLRGFLDSNGIPAQIESLKFHMEPVNVGSLAEIRIYVNADQESDALELLRRRDDQYASLKEGEVNTDEGPATIDDDSNTGGNEP